MDVSLYRRPARHHGKRQPVRMFHTTSRASLRFTVLAFESSADDTCAAVVTSSRQILSNVIIKQNHL